MKKKIIILVGTRPEIIRLSVIIQKFQRHFNTIVVNSFQNFNNNLNKLFFKEFDLKPAKYNLKSNNKSPIIFLSNLLINFDRILEKEKPSALLILGDTNTSLASICAKKKQIPIFHMEAGNRCFDQRVPEEINRKIVDNISDINMVYSDVAKQNLIKENFDLDKIFKIGSPLPEVFQNYKKKIESSKILNTLKASKNKYFVVSCHREENVDYKNNLKIIIECLNTIAINYKTKIFFSIHPRTKKKLKDYKIRCSKKIIFLEPLGFFDYIKLQLNSQLTISDSGSITEESNILNFAAVNLRNTFERQEGMEVGTAILTSINKKSILESVKIAINRKLNFVPKTHPDYISIDVSEKVISIVASYIDYINSKTWVKNK